MTPADKACIKQLLVPDEYGKRPSLQQVATLYGVSRERIRQIAGNQGYRKSVDLLKKKSHYWQDRLYCKEDIAPREIAKLYGVSECNVNLYVGSKLEYERRVGKRKCTRCKRWKEFPDDFYKQNKTSRTTFCKKCGNIRTGEWIAANRERFNKRMRAYHKTPQQLEYQRKYAKQYRLDQLEEKRKKDRDAYHRRKSLQGKTRH